MRSWLDCALRSSLQIPHGLQPMKMLRCKGSRLRKFHTYAGGTPMTSWEHRSRRLSLAASVASTTIALCLSANAADVTYERLLNSANEPQNWLMRAGNYSNWNNSKLAEINRGNVANLKVKFMFGMSDPTRPSKAAQYFTPIVED